MWHARGEGFHRNLILATNDHTALGIDIGGSSLKSAIADIRAGRLTTPTYSVPTPRPAAPGAIAEKFKHIAGHFKWRGRVGCTYPGIVKNGVCMTAANVDKAWIGVNIEQLLTETLGQRVSVLNDADAAGLAEMAFGAGRDRRGVVLMLTFGTGIGSALFMDGRLLPNTELGHMEINGRDAELQASARVKTENNLDWAAWAERVNTVLERMEALLSPDLFIIGGGVSENHAEFFPLLRTSADILPATLHNDAGIIGAALATQKAAGVD